MALSNYEKQKRWREKNRALYNLQQRNRRKKNLPVPVLAESAETHRVIGGEARESTKSLACETDQLDALIANQEKDSCGGQTNLSGGELGEGKPTGTSNHPSDEGQVSPPAQSKDETLEKLRGLIKVEEEKPRAEVSAAVKVVRKSPTGMILTEEQWEARQEYERKALEKGFVPDEYSQA